MATAERRSPRLVRVHEGGDRWNRTTVQVMTANGITPSRAVVSGVRQAIARRYRPWIGELDGVRGPRPLRNGADRSIRIHPLDGVPGLGVEATPELSTQAAMQQRWFSS